MVLRGTDPIVSATAPRFARDDGRRVPLGRDAVRLHAVRRRGGAGAVPPVGSSRAPPVGRQGLLRLDVLRRHVDAHRLRRLRHGRRRDDARCVESHPHVRVLLLGVPRDGVASQDDALRPGKTNSRPGGSAQLAQCRLTSSTCRPCWSTVNYVNTSKLLNSRFVDNYAMGLLTKIFKKKLKLDCSTCDLCPLSNMG